jgi:L-alanine-DL-glutamate epimerase-like enolase superfamily enzyme
MIEAQGTHIMGLGLTEMLMGIDPGDAEGLWEKMYRGSAMTGRRGLGICAIGALDMALWDLLGRKRDVPVHELLGYKRAYPKLPYASQLFSDTSEQTLSGCRAARERGFRAVKCGWGPFGRRALSDDRDQLQAAREGLGSDGVLLIDAGQIFREDVEAAAARIPLLEEVRATWFEEPFLGGAYDAYAALSARGGKISTAGGEASHNFHMARQLIDYGKVAYVQIDCGRIGGIAPAKRVADYAAARGVTYVNHTFTSHLAFAHRCNHMLA